jgi:hypothetical protein
MAVLPGKQPLWGDTDMTSKKKTSASTRIQKSRKSSRAAAAPNAAAETVTMAKPAASAAVAEAPQKHGKSRRAATAEPAAPAETPPKRGALESAVQVLREEGRPMNCGELIAAMAAKNYWTSPAGKTPASTLYAAVLNEITTKGTASRFVKVARGQFTLREAVK